jgi:hypothetical protein
MLGTATRKSTLLINADVLRFFDVVNRFGIDRVYSLQGPIDLEKVRGHSFCHSECRDRSSGLSLQ